MASEAIFGPKKITSKSSL